MSAPILPEPESEVNCEQAIADGERVKQYLRRLSNALKDRARKALKDGDAFYATKYALDAEHAINLAALCGSWGADFGILLVEYGPREEAPDADA